MSDVKPALIEIGCEELPPKSLQKLADAFLQEVSNGLNQAKLNFANIKVFASPRRLALIIDDLATTQPSQNSVRRGPALNAAFNADGEPTPALLGFMRSCGVSDVQNLEREETDKGAWLSYSQHQVGKSTENLLPEIVITALKRLPIPKPMRWGANLDEFVRPVHWVLMLFGNDVVPAKIMGATAGRLSYGHRFMAPNAIEIAHPDEYVSKLKSAFVVADFNERREIIASKVTKLAEDHQAKVQLEPDLLDEVTGLVEWPVPICVSFPEEFLRVPSEALIAAMRDHQKCFSLRSSSGALLPLFITVSNIQSKDESMVVAGNERVMRARLSDAAFFFDADNKINLADRLPLLKTVIFQVKLGSVYDKSERLSKLAGLIAGKLGVNVQDAERAGLLSKCDLVSSMVGEFPELQGIMGAYYAKASGESAAVANALREYYHPAFAKDVLPSDAISDALALSERLDTLIGIFSIQKPTGEKDPYGLRRAALGVVRILVEKKYTLDLQALLTAAYQGYGDTLKDPKIIDEVHQYILERLKAWYAEAGIPTDAVLAVLESQKQDLYDIDRRIYAVQAFRELPQAAALAEANKRVKRLLEKNLKESLIDPESPFILDAEQALAEKLMKLETELSPLYEKGDYKQMLIKLAELHEPVDRFFTEVMVMVDDMSLRALRLRLLMKLRDLFLRVADISLLQ